MIKSSLFFWSLTTAMLWHSAVLTAQSQPDEYVVDYQRNDDYIYHKNIRSLRLIADGNALSYPIVDLRGGTKLSLTFDDLDADYKDYFYTIVHCDANWQPSKLIQDIDYIDGFNEDRILNFRNSSGTFTAYTHYSLVLPNEQMGWKISGNYLLLVYLNGDRRDLVLSRRFMVTDQLYQIVPTLTRAADAEKSFTHQELDFELRHKGTVLNRAEIIAHVLQNGRWDNAVLQLSPTFERGEAMVFDYQDRIVFSGGMEFREADLRTFRYQTQRVERIVSHSRGFDLYLFKEFSRALQSYLFNIDANGNFVVDNLDEDSDFEADYGNVFFSLAAPEVDPKSHNIYLFGKLTDWKLLKSYQLQQDKEDKLFKLQLKLLQGYYNYCYVAEDKATGEIAHHLLEGNSFQTENDYVILVYHRPFGTRYDRLVATKVLNTSRTD